MKPLGSARALVTLLAFVLAGFVVWRVWQAPRAARVRTHAAREESIGPLATEPSSSTSELAVLDTRGERVSRTAGALRHFVHTTAGAPIADAVVTATQVEEAWFSSGVWPDLEWSLADEHSASVTSDAGGAFELPPRSGVAAKRTIVWITHPQFVARSFALDGDGATLPPRIELESASRISVRVVDTGAAPVSGATVVQLPDLLAADLGEHRSRESDAQLVFRRAVTTDANGMATLVPLAGMQWIHAEKDGLRTTSWRGRQPAEITLQLVPTFTVEGAIIPEDGVRLGGNLSVRCSARIDRELVELDQVNSNGAQWGPMTLPIVDCQDYVFQLQGGTIAQDEVTIAPPAAGAHATVDFHPRDGVRLRVRVVDEQSIALSGAAVSVHWNVGSRFARIERITGADGVARFDNFRPGYVWVRARCEGYAPVLFEGPDVESAPSEPITITLKKAGRIAGRCTHAGKPVTSFTLMFWQSHPDNAVPWKVPSSPDGSFLIDEAPVGEVFVLATCDAFPSPPSRHVSVTVDGTEHIVFEFPRSLSGHGTVVDGMTGEAIQNASLQVYSTHDSFMLRPWGAPRSTDAHGRFELDGLQSGTNCVEIAAAGHATRNLIFQGGDQPELDLDRIALFAKQSVLIRLTARDTQDFRTFRADMNGPSYFELRNFAENGELLFEGVDPGLYGVRIVYPGSTTVTTWAQVRPESRRTIDVPISAKRCTVEIATESGERLPQGSWLRVDFPSANGEFASQFYSIPDDQRVEILNVQPLRAVLQIDTAEQVVIGVERVDFSRVADGGVITVRLPKFERTVRVVDAAREPVANAKVVATSPTEPGGWNQQLVTDDNGECVLRGMALGSVNLLAYEPARGVMPSREFELVPATKPIELILDPRLALNVKLMERDAPAANVEVAASDMSELSFGLPIARSRANGLAQWFQVGAGDFHVRVQHPGYWPTDAYVRSSSEDSPSIVQVRRLGGLDVSIVNAYGNPAAGISFDLYSAELHAWVSEWIAQERVPKPAIGLVTDATGQLHVRGLPNGEFRWRAVGDDGQVHEGTTVVPPSAIASVSITIP